jgi:hypothetical protein
MLDLNKSGLRFKMHVGIYLYLIINQMCKGWALGGDREYTFDP